MFDPQNCKTNRKLKNVVGCKEIRRLLMVFEAICPNLLLPLLSFCSPYSKPLNFKYMILGFFRDSGAINNLLLRGIISLGYVSHLQDFSKILYIKIFISIHIYSLTHLFLMLSGIRQVWKISPWLNI